MKPIPPPPFQLKAARLLLGWSREEVGRKLERSTRMIGQAEIGQAGRSLPGRLAALYEAASVEFMSGGQVRLKAGGSD
jgi:transcriptional regulator with XRE-family HTH domain